jgi:hypothetical protein
MPLDITTEVPSALPSALPSAHKQCLHLTPKTAVRMAMPVLGAYGFLLLGNALWLLGGHPLVLFVLEYSFDTELQLWWLGCVGVPISQQQYERARVTTSS